MSNLVADHARVLVSWLGILGIPPIFTITLWCAKECYKFTKKLEILHAAQKAQMRSQLLSQYYEIKNREYVYVDELDDWVNQYIAYHELVGENGVLDARKAELIAMPSKVR